jgi:hypothetical protein
MSGCKYAAKDCVFSHNQMETQGLHWCLECEVDRRGSPRTAKKPVPVADIPGRCKARREKAKKDAAQARQEGGSRTVGGGGVAPPGTGAAGGQPPAAPDGGAGGVPPKKNGVNGNPPAEFHAFDTTAAEDGRRRVLHEQEHAVAWLVARAQIVNTIEPLGEPEGPEETRRRAMMDQLEKQGRFQGFDKLHPRVALYLRTRILNADFGRETPQTEEALLGQAVDEADQELSAAAQKRLEALPSWRVGINPDGNTSLARVGEMTWDPSGHFA